MPARCPSVPPPRPTPTRSPRSTTRASPTASRPSRRARARSTRSRPGSPTGCRCWWRRRTARCSGSPACRPTRTAASTRASASTASTSPARRAGGGVGRRLLEALAAASEQAGYYKLTSRVFADNAASRAVHLAAGFTEVGIQRRHGRLDGEWKDCVLVERLLGDAPLVALDHPEAVAVRVAEREHRRHVVAHAHDLRVGVDARGAAAPRGPRRRRRSRGSPPSRRPGTSASDVAAPGGATSSQRPPSPKGPSMRTSKPSVPT